ncbi:hypothetical protein [uncultured Cohaesibacter sp.]|uniref:hypothetical protein n=1 Tax=uncultured Cohaesibacter sp. TaxID=1002546 RepID=UPI0029307958|nr:hypothetical protein [uncultured Cohaesibacter sp.]
MDQTGGNPATPQATSITNRILQSKASTASSPFGEDASGQVHCLFADTPWFHPPAFSPNETIKRKLWIETIQSFKDAHHRSCIVAGFHLRSIYDPI